MGDTNWVVINPYHNKDKAKGFIADSRESILRQYRVKQMSPFNYTRPMKMRMEFLFKNFILPVKTKVYVDLTELAIDSSSISVLRVMWAKLEYFCGFEIIDSVSFINMNRSCSLDFLTMSMLYGPRYIRKLSYNVLPEHDLNNCNMLLTNEMHFMDSIKAEAKGNYLPYQIVPIGEFNF